MKSISIPGIPQIVTTKSHFFKVIWTILIFLAFAIGFWNISQAINDYYKFDKITNIERVLPTNVTFPAITICAIKSYTRSHYKNGSLTKIDTIQIRHSNVSRISKFLDGNSLFFPKDLGYYLLDLSDHWDFFHIIADSFAGDCVRFNAVTNKSVEPLKATSTEDFYDLVVANFYIENISGSWPEYYNYSFSDTKVQVYIGDNSLNSFEGRNDHFHLFAFCI